MHKRAVILHGTDGRPDINWLPWLEKQLIAKGYDTWVPQLPDCHTPNRFIYDEFFRNSGWDFSKNLVIGHSSGATALLNLLASDWFPVIDEAIFVGIFLSESKLSGVEWYESGQFDNLFPEAFDMEKIKSKAHKRIFIHGSDDPYCDYDEAANFCRKVNGEFIAVDGGLHLSSNRRSLPEALPYI